MKMMTITTTITVTMMRPNRVNSNRYNILTCIKYYIYKISYLHTICSS